MSAEMGVFFDTNILYYLFDASEAAKRDRARELFEKHALNGELVISTQVLVELYSSLTRKAKKNPDDVIDVISSLVHERVMPTSAEFVERALRLARERQLSSWDGLIVQAALDADCHVLLTEDLQAGSRFGSLQVVNPFAHEVHEPAAEYKAKRALPRGRR